MTLHTGTAITTIGSNSKSAEMFLLPYAIMERIQVTVFFLQECILSCLYLWKARNFLSLRRSRNAHGKAHQKLRLMMVHLIISNIIVLAREYRSILSVLTAEVAILQQSPALRTRRVWLAASPHDVSHSLGSKRADLSGIHQST